MTTYSYYSIMGGGYVDTIEGIQFTTSTPINFSTDQYNLNAYVPSRLHRYINGVLNNDVITLTEKVAAEEVVKNSTNTARYSLDTNGNVTGLVGPDGSDAGVPVGRSGSRPLLYTLKQPIAAGSVLADLATASFGGVGGGSGSVGGLASVYGLIPIDLVVAAGSATNTASATVSDSFPFMDDGGAFTLVAEIVNGFTTNDTIKLELSSDAFATKSETATYTHHAYREGGLIFFQAYPSSNAFIAAGGETWSSTMNTIKITATSAGGTVGGTLRVHGLWKYHKQRPTITIQFDDGRLTQYKSVFQYMASKGLVGDIGVIGSRVGTAGYCSLTQLREMYAAGWGMVTHGDKNHTHGTFTTAQNIIDDVAINRDYILGNIGDRGAYHYIYPGGIVNTTLGSKEAIQAAGMRSSRLVISQINGRWRGYGIDNPYAMFARDLSSAYSAASDLTMVDRAIEAGASAIFYGHEIVRTGATSGLEMNYSEFQTFIDGVSDRVRDGKVDVITQSKLIDG